MKIMIICREMRQCCRWLLMFYFITLNLYAFKCPKEMSHLVDSQAGDRALCIQTGVTASPPSSPPPRYLWRIMLSSLAWKLIWKENCLYQLLLMACLGLWAGLGRWEGGLETMEPQTLNSQKSKLGGWVPKARTWTQYSSLEQPEPHLQIKNNPHLSKCHVKCIQVFFHNGSTAQVSATHM